MTQFGDTGAILLNFRVNFQIFKFSGTVSDFPSFSRGFILSHSIVGILGK